MDSQERGSSQKYIGDPIKYLNSVRHEAGEIFEYEYLLYGCAKVKQGDVVRKGDIIAPSGNTGLSTEPYLHFPVAEVIDEQKK